MKNADVTEWGQPQVGANRIAIASLVAAGFVIADRNVHLGEPDVDIDVIVTGAGDVSFFVQWVPSLPDGSPMLGGQAGLRAALVRCAQLTEYGFGPNLLLALRGFTGVGVRTLLKGTDRECVYDLLGLSGDVKRLRWMARVDEETLRADMARDPQLDTLLAARERRPCRASQSRRALLPTGMHP